MPSNAAIFAESRDSSETVNSCLRLSTLIGFVFVVPLPVPLGATKYSDDSSNSPKLGMYEGVVSTGFSYRYVPARLSPM